MLSRNRRQRTRSRVAKTLIVGAVVAAPALILAVLVLAAGAPTQSGTVYLDPDHTRYVPLGAYDYVDAWCTCSENCDVQFQDIDFLANVGYAPATSVTASSRTVWGNADWSDWYTYQAGCPDEFNGHGSATAPLCVVEVPAFLQFTYRYPGETSWRPGSTIYVWQGATIELRAPIWPQDAQWPTGKPEWSSESEGVTVDSVTDGIATVTFGTASTDGDHYKIVEAECGNTRSTSVLVCGIGGMEYENPNQADDWKDAIATNMYVPKDDEVNFRPTPSPDPGEDNRPSHPTYTWQCDECTGSQSPGDTNMVTFDEVSDTTGDFKYVTARISSEEFATAEVIVIDMVIKREIAGGAVEYEVLTDSTRKILPGQKMNLKCEIIGPAGLTIDDRQWTLPGVTFENYTADEDDGILTGLEANDLDAATVHYYWASTGDDQAVEHKVKIDGTWSVRKREEFHVKKPTCTLTTTLGTVDINAAETEFGLLADADSTHGITWTGGVTMPTGFAAGKWHFVQMVTPDTHVKYSTGTVSHFSLNGTLCLDSYYPLQPLPRGAHPGSAGAWSTGVLTHTYHDSPRISIGILLKRVWFNEEVLRTYLMFLPPGEETRYVQLKYVDWRWGGAATRSVVSWTREQGSFESVLPAAETTTHPEWSVNVMDGEMEDEDE